MQVPIAAVLGLGKSIHEAQRHHSELVGTALRSGLDATFIVVAPAVRLAVPGLFVYRRRPEV